MKKGRGVFYPTYFNRLSLEVINPHKRETKAGTQPIYFEVVPEGTEGIFQFMYIPHDAISLPMKVMKKQAEVDRIFLEGLITDVLEESGIGSKTKYGWGRANIKKIVFCIISIWVVSRVSSLDLERLEDKRTEIIKAEIGALLFNLGKTHAGFEYWRYKLSF